MSDRRVHAAKVRAAQVTRCFQQMFTWFVDTGAPCLSFDVLRDGDGDGREQFPLSMLLCAGTQADTAMSNRYRTAAKWGINRCF